MPYNTLNELPKAVKDHVPKHGQEIYKEAYNSAYKEYDNPKDRRGNQNKEETAARVAWSAVKEKYQKGAYGQWHRKES